MNKGIIVGCALCLGVLSSQAENIDVKKFQYAGPYAIQKPFLVEQTDVQGKEFAEKNLLKSTLSLDALRFSQTFSDGILPQSNGYALHLVGFSVDNTHFAKGKLTVKGVKNYTVYIDGKEQTGEDLALEPATHQIVIKCLTGPNTKDTVAVNLESERDGMFTLNSTTKRMYTLTDVLDGKRFSQVDLSVDGRYMITGYTTTFEDASREQLFRITEVATGRVVAETSNSVRWMPKSCKYYYVRRIVGGKDLVSVDPKTGAETIIAHNIPDGDFQMSPTEDYLLYSLVEEGPKEQQDIYQILEPDDRQPGWRDRCYLAKYDIKTGLMQRLTYGYRSVYGNAISDDGKDIIFTVNKQRITQRPFTLSSVYRMNVQTLKVDTLMNDEGYIASCMLSPDGKQLLVMGSGDAFNGIGLKIKEGQKSSYFDNQLYLYDIASKKVTPLTKDFDPSVGSFEWSRADGNIYFIANNRDYISLYEMDMPSGKIEQISVPEDIIKQFSLASASPIMAYYGESVSNANRLYTLNLKNRKSALYEDLSREILKDIELGECHAWNFKSSHGDTIYGRYYLPPHFDATKKYPMIVNYYGGCTPTERSFESRYPHNVYASLGYVVYVVEPSGAIGFGQEFSARHVNAWGDYTADEIIEGTKQFCKEHDFVDAKKIGCIGASYGGFMTQLLQTKTDIFASAISHAGISNITSYWGEGYWGYSYSEAASADSYPWNNPELYTEHSPLFHADKIHTPILFLHGSVDTNVPIGESIQMFTALKMLGRETAFVTIDGQNHQIMDYHKRIKWQNTIFAWFAKWLQDDPTWWNTLYPEKKL